MVWIQRACTSMPSGLLHNTSSIPIDQDTFIWRHWPIWPPTVSIIVRSLKFSHFESIESFVVDQCGESPVQRFVSPPKVGSTQTLRFGIVGDVGQTEYSKETLGYLKTYVNLTAVLHAGDLSYADFDQARWDTWGNLIDPLASQIPWMVRYTDRCRRVSNADVRCFAS